MIHSENIEVNYAFISLATLLLKEGGREIQEACYNYLKGDLDNKFMLSMEKYLLKATLLFGSSETLRLDVKKSKAMELKLSKNSIVEKELDIMMLEKESTKYTDKLVKGLYFL